MIAREPKGIFSTLERSSVCHNFDLGLLLQRTIIHALVHLFKFDCFFNDGAILIIVERFHIDWIGACGGQAHRQCRRVGLTHCDHWPDRTAIHPTSRNFGERSRGDGNFVTTNSYHLDTHVPTLQSWGCRRLRSGGAILRQHSDEQSEVRLIVNFSRCLNFEMNSEIGPSS